VQFTHTLKQRKVLNEESLDIVREQVVVITFATLLFVSFSSKRNILFYDGLHLLSHRLHLFMRESLHTEIKILLNLILYKFSLSGRIKSQIAVHNLVTAKFQKIHIADSVITFIGRRFKPLANKFSKFIIHN